VKHNYEDERVNLDKGGWRKAVMHMEEKSNINVAAEFASKVNMSLWLQSGK
jgi:hypothetical protein